MKTKISLIIAMMAMTVMAYGQDGERRECCVKSDYASGFYMGVHGGSNFLQANRTDNTGIAVSTFTLENDVHSIGAVVGGHTGYLWNWDGFMFGPEAYFDYSPNHNNHVSLDNDYKYKVENRWSAGGHFRLGAVVKEAFMLYGLIGGKVTKVEYEVSEPAANVSNCTSSYAPALVYGLGVEKAIDSNHRIRFEVTRSHYQTKTFVVNQTTGTAAVHDAVYSGLVTEATIGYSYYF